MSLLVTILILTLFGISAILVIGWSCHVREARIHAKLSTSASIDQVQRNSTETLVKDESVDKHLFGGLLKERMDRMKYDSSDRSHNE
jgi:FtsZ-interacting cell division protein ZipA